MPSPGLDADPLAALTALPGVAEGVERSRAACDALGWHPAMRRRTHECRAEAVARAAHASAGIDGARLPLVLLRDALRGAATLPADPVGEVVAGALRATSGAASLAATWRSAPRQAVARLHALAVAGLVPGDAGRPRDDAAALRLDALAGLLADGSRAPALVLAAVSHAEVATVPAFAVGSGVVARALARLVVTASGLDRTGTAVPEAAWLDDGPGYAAALDAYASGGTAGVAHWLRYAADTLVAGCDEGRAVADAVLAGRLST